MFQSKIPARALLPAVSMLISLSAQAQSSGCEDFKNRLAARVDPSIRSFTLEIVPADSPLPAGGKVFGTCDGGRYRIVFRRGGAARPASAAAESVSVLPVAAPASAAAPPRPAPPPPATVEVSVAPPVLQQPQAALVAEAASAAAEPAPAEEAPAATAPWPQQVAEFMAGRWAWAGGLLLLPLLGVLWMWHAHRSAYDSAGLPRGPKL